MKKLFTLLCVLGLTLSASAVETVECTLAIDTWPWNYTADPIGEITVSFTSNYGEFVLYTPGDVDLTEYKGYELEVSAVENVQMKIQYTDDPNLADNEYSGDYPALEVGTFTKDFSYSTGTLTAFSLQATSATASVTVDAAYLIKSDDTKVALTYVGPSWGCTYTANSYAITYTGQYGGQQIVKAEDGSSITFTYGEGKTYEFIAEFEEAVAANVLMFEADNSASTGVQWYNITEEASSWTFKIFDSAAEDDGGVSVDIAKVYMKANSGTTTDYPFTVTPKSIKYNIYTADEEVSNGISVVKAAENTSDAVYNLSGQRVSNSYKGLVIKNGKKVIVK